jgi:ABC-type branched-subunit amino acid transport system substrate-binding protein
MARRSLRCTLVVLALVTSACGSRLSDEQYAAATDARAEQGTGPRATTAPAGGTAPAGADPAGTPVDAGAPTDVAAPTGDDPAAAGECVPQPVQETGVTDTSITVANVATISGPIAGFGQTARNAVQAYFNYVNSQGGVCGRTLELATGDDRLDAGTNRAETQRLAGEAFAFVGGISVVDNGGAGVLAGTNIPDVTLSIGSERMALPNNFSPNPIDPAAGGNGTDAIMRHFAGQGVASAAVVYPAQADARARGQGYIADLRAAGIATVDTYEVAITETNYVNVAQQIENKGSQLVITALEVSGMSRLAQAFQQVGYRPQVPFYGAQAYGNQFLELAGPAAEGTVIAVTHNIFEDAGSVPAVATFLDQYRATAPGSDPDFFSVMAWAAADMLVQALRAAGPAPTRDAVLAHLRTQTAFTAEGLLSPRNPAAKDTGECFAVITVEGGAWRRVEPAAGFVNC